MNKAVIFILVCHSSSSIGDSKFDFGLFENELFLKTVSQEDRKLTSTLENLNRKYQDETLNKFLQKTARVSEKLDFIQHPINAYQIIKKYAIVSSLSLKINHIYLCKASSAPSVIPGCRSVTGNPGRSPGLVFLIIVSESCEGGPAHPGTDAQHTAAVRI